MAQNRPAASQSQVEDGYLLGGGDRVKIDFFNVPEYSGEYQVLPNGTINLPEVGAVTVQGRTLRQAAAAIATQYASLLTRPIITVSLVAARPVTIAIAGEVNRPGSYTVPISSSTGNNPVPTITRIIQLAGGTTQAADLRNIQVRRPRPSNMGSAETLRVNLWELVQSGDTSQDMRLQDGDSIVISAAPTVNLSEAQQLASTNFASTSDRPIKVAVVGEVNRPGPHLLTDTTEGETGNRSSDLNLQVPTVTRAIQVAGGITQSADIRKIQVRRFTRNGHEQTTSVDLWQLLQSGNMRQDLPLQDGDTILVPTATALNSAEIAKLASASFAPDRITVNVVGEVARPGAIQLPPNTPLNQATLAAGGFNNRARKGSVSFVRLNPDGTVARRSVSVNFAQGLGENNPALRNNDTIVVGRSTFTQITDALGSALSPFGGVFGLFRILGL
jgi:polysaccharide export outer membrane protein